MQTISHDDPVYPASPLLHHIDARVLDDVLRFRAVERIQHVQSVQQAHDLIIDHLTLNNPAAVELVGACLTRLVEAIREDDRFGAASARMVMCSVLVTDPVLDDMVTYAAAMSGAPGAVSAVRAMYVRVDDELSDWLEVYGPHASRIRAVGRWIDRVKSRRDRARQMIIGIDERGEMLRGVAPMRVIPA